ncbi:Glycosyl transferase family 2 [Pseudobutyrivibrio sp. JW11]|uniref:glycosyltransferase n=1 Tax=Pseudobutyrivibrio sp. JW11 TaxID=1855302 RepID=UPI0008E18FCD|nr:glycosyltransferase [Pseudobutyrivibrio sp. JW11]SFO34955.1 Glycosyl transferase family 2 [Pseudobutyrivibrio sp. JW11]
MKRYNNYTGDDLTLVICSYKECEYLEESVESIVNQTVKPKILISTSTPNEYIKNIAEKYKIEVRINPNGGQINDYNFAMKQADTELVMLAHQDEILKETFVEKSLEALNMANDPIISFTDYIEIHNDIVDEKQSSMIKIKKFLLWPTKIKWLINKRLGKRLTLCFGDPITHPSVICVKSKMPKQLFREEYKASMDWDLWERLSQEKGSFVYVDHILLYHRMNDMNQTALLLKTSNERYENEFDIFCRFWPKWFARILMKFYSKAYLNY